MTSEDKDKFLAEKFGWRIVQSWQPSELIDQVLGDGGPGTVVGELEELGWRLDYIRRCDNGFECAFFKPLGAGAAHEVEALGIAPALAIRDAAVKALGGEGI